MGRFAELRIGDLAVVTKNDGHPDQYLWIRVGTSTFFLGVLVDGMTRRDVKRLAREWLALRA